MTTEIKIRQFLGKYFNADEITNEDNIFELGLVNSLFAMQLVNFIESEFDIAVDNNELDLENFKCISAIVRLVESKAV